MTASVGWRARCCKCWGSLPVWWQLLLGLLVTGGGCVGLLMLDMHPSFGGARLMWVSTWVVGCSLMHPPQSLGVLGAELSARPVNELR
jgi:hypothetical protein